MSDKPAGGMTNRDRYLGDVLDIARDNTIQIQNSKEYTIAGVQNYGAGIINRRKVKGLALTMKKYQVIEKDELMWCKVDTKNGAFGVTKAEHVGSLASTNMTLAKIRKDICLPEFIETLFQIDGFHQAITKASSGSTNRKYLTPTQLLEQVRIPNLSLAAQEKWLKRINAIRNSGLKNELATQSTYLTQLRQAILQEAIEGKLTAAWREKKLPSSPKASARKNPSGLPQASHLPLAGEEKDGSEGSPPAKGEYGEAGRGFLTPRDGKDLPAEYYDAAVLLEKIKAEKAALIAKGKIKKEKPLPPIEPGEAPFALPAGWVWTRLGEVASAQDPNPSHRMPKYARTGIPFISTMNVNDDGKIDFNRGKKVTEETLQLQKEAYTLQPDSFAFTRIGTIGTVFKLPLPQDYCLSHSVSIISPYISGECEYLMRLLSSGYILSQAKKGVTHNTVPDLGMKTIREFPIPLPPLAEQHAIVERVDKLLAMVDELEQQVAERKVQAEELMQAVLREAFG